MTSMKAAGMPGLVALALIAAPSVMAQDAGWYAGFNVGQSKAKLENDKIIRGIVPTGFTITSTTDNDHGTGFKVFGGYQFNSYVSFEGGYFDLGKAGFKAATVPLGTLNAEMKVKGVSLDAVLNIPFTERFSFFARVGAASAETKDTFERTGAVLVANPTPNDRAINLKYGGGLQYDFIKSFGMRVEWERYRINDAVANKGDIDLASIGFLFRFGRRTDSPVAYTAPPEPTPITAPEPYVAPTPVVVPAVARTQQYCTILDIQFEIDKGDIQREESERFAVIGTFLAKYPDTTVVIEGHTDNVGAREHNMELSRKRAESVVNYLVETNHIDRSRLSSVGYGDTRPVSDNSTEQGKRENRRINAVVSCVTDIEGLKVAPARVTMAMEIEFDLMKDEIKPEHRDDLRKAAGFLKANPLVTATVEGHAGKLKTTDTSAMAISMRRAQNVVNCLVENFGIERSRLTAEGFGKTRRFAYSTTLEGQQENRRVNLIINYPNTPKS
ncbi:MAG: OmpA family protein [Acidobacteria bacterium]|nr:OmpA family protein [Acidobacteriota bacterium]MBI3487212.1 OmpA family protein [Acidobacteriota bacterium]